MHTLQFRSVRRPLAVLIASATVAVASPVGAASPPTTPDGYVELVDDTGTITVAVPDTWIEVDTVPAAEGADVIPYISASPDYVAFLETFDAPGVIFKALPYNEDVQSVIDQFGLPDGCDELEVVPYDDGAFVGLAQVGTSCGGAGTASWVMIAANPADNAFTAAVQMQAASTADEEALDIVLQSFDSTSPGAAPGSTPASTAPDVFVPTMSVPVGLGPVEVAQLFLDSLAAGDGETACALLAAEEMTINFVEDAATCAADLSTQVAGQGDFWASVQITGDENTSSPGQCGDEEAGDDYVSLELQGPTDDGCLSIGQETDGAWRIEDLSNSIWNQAG